MLIKPSPPNISKQRWQWAIIQDFRGFWSKIAPYAILKSKNRIGAQFLSHYLSILDIKILVSNLKRYWIWPMTPLLSKWTKLCQNDLIYVISEDGPIRPPPPKATGRPARAASPNTFNRVYRGRGQFLIRMIQKAWNVNIRYAIIRMFRIKNLPSSRRWCQSLSQKIIILLKL